MKNAYNSDKFDDASIAKSIAEDEGFDEKFCWSGAYGWMEWDGTRWRTCTDVRVREALADLASNLYKTAMKGNDLDEIGGWRSLLETGKLNSVLLMLKGSLEVRGEIFDSDPDVLNTPSGLVEFRLGKMRACEPKDYITKITSGSYHQGYTHPDWKQALEAIPEDIRRWMQIRIGQAATGHPTPDGVMPLLQGDGDNGKSSFTTDGLVPALGGYGSVASAKLITSVRRGQDHSTEKADLQGQRFIISEEMTEGHSLDVKAIKEIQDVSSINARRVYKDNVSFATSHSLFATTNYIPRVNEVDHGTWRRLALVVFPYKFGSVVGGVVGGVDNSWERQADFNLDDRIRLNESGQHDAIVTWVVEGAMRWYEDKTGVEMELPERVVSDTKRWRADADKIMAFWEEKLEAAESKCVLVIETLEIFNDWLTAQGHTEWSLETFVSRFSQHEETRRRGVEKVRTKKLSGLQSAYTKPKQATVWQGANFRAHR